MGRRCAGRDRYQRAEARGRGKIPVVPSPPAALRTLARRYDPDVFAPQRTARVRLAVTGGGAWDALIEDGRLRLVPADGDAADAELHADPDTWEAIAADVRGGMDAFRRGRLRVRRDLHLGVGLLAATSGAGDEGRLRFAMVPTKRGTLSTLEAGTGDPVVAIHGLGATKASMLPTVAALAPRFRVIALDLPGFGDSDKPLGAPYDARYFARAGGAVVVPEPELDLRAQVGALLSDAPGLAAMGAAMSGLAKPDAAGVIADELVALARG